MFCRYFRLLVGDILSKYGCKIICFQGKKMQIRKVADGWLREYSIMQ